MQAVFVKTEKKQIAILMGEKHSSHEDYFLIFDCNRASFDSGLLTATTTYTPNQHPYSSYGICLNPLQHFLFNKGKK